MRMEAFRGSLHLTSPAPPAVLLSQTPNDGATWNLARPSPTPAPMAAAFPRRTPVLFASLRLALLASCTRASKIGIGEALLDKLPPVFAASSEMTIHALSRCCCIPQLRKLCYRVRVLQPLGQGNAIGR
jgi:hypothetical protein